MSDIRIGHGYDLHILKENRKLILAGVEIPFDKGLYGHSDADVVAHAVSDCVLGAMALGDIGKFFPDTDNKFKDADSINLLKICIKKMSDMEFKLNNIDVTVIAQLPKLAPYISAMRECLADCFNADISAVNVKATTEEGMGATGKGDAIACHCVGTFIKSANI